ncbi:MAG: hypothetical protein ACXAEI_18510 [Candidatus Hodarchaeales archaeon]|jgi:surface polysaccharide O-acyltransferase-like enzyme
MLKHQRRQLGSTLFVLGLFVGAFSVYFIVAGDDAWIDLIDYGLCSLIVLIIAPFIVVFQRFLGRIRTTEEGKVIVGDKPPIVVFSFIINWGSFLIAIPLSLIILTYPEVVALSDDILKALNDSGIVEESLVLGSVGLLWAAALFVAGFILSR